MADRVFYHGCINEPGHFLFDSAGRWITGETPFPFHHHQLDGGFCHSSEHGERQGRAKLTHVEGWTVLAFWDRTVDKRGACNSAFVADGEHSFDEMCKLAESHFPEVWKRVTSAFDVVLWEPPPPHFFYFGCWGESGHYLFKPNGHTVYERGPKPGVKLPWKYLDGTLVPHGNPIVEEKGGGRSKKETPRDLQVQSLAALHQKDGWTALSMWDRSVDTRHGCNANFFVKGEHTYAEMIPIIEKHFPAVWKRINDAAPVRFFGRLSNIGE